MKPIGREPVTASEIKPAWIALVREIVQREGQALRAHGSLPMIEGKSLRTNQWLPVMLEGSGFAFTTNADRDAVLAQIVAP